MMMMILMLILMMMVVVMIQFEHHFIFDVWYMVSDAQWFYLFLPPFWLHWTLGVLSVSTLLWKVRVCECVMCCCWICFIPLSCSVHLYSCTELSVFSSFDFVKFTCSRQVEMCLIALYAHHSVFRWPACPICPRSETSSTDVEAVLRLTGQFEWQNLV